MDSKFHLQSIKEKGFTVIKNALHNDVVEKLILKIRKISKSHKNDFYPGFSNVRKKDKQISFIGTFHGRDDSSRNG